MSESPIGVSSNPAENLDFQQVKESFIGLREHQVFFSYYRCQECGLLYAPKYFTPEQLDTLYREMPDNLMGEDKNTISKTQAGYVKWAKKSVGSIVNYLEIGPDIGLVGQAVCDEFNPRSACMIEPNVNIHPELRNSLRSISQVSIKRYLEEVEADSVFDFVAGIHVYDHLLNPKEDLLKLRDFTVQGSNLLIVVHNEESLLRKIMKSKWPPFCLQHPQIFNRDSLRSILDNSGWRLQRVSRSVNWWHLEHFAELASGVIGIRSSWAKALPNIQIPIKLGNQIVLASRK